MELLLHPKSTVLEERVTLSNRSDVRHRFYWWNNAGIQAWDDSQIVYPMRFAASHGFTEVRPWPIDDGLDLSVLRNHTRGPVSEFVPGSILQTARTDYTILGGVADDVEIHMA